MKRRFVVATAVVLTVGQVFPALAWGPGGHKQVADIAWVGLNDKAKFQIKAILRAGDRLFKPKNNSVSALRDAFRLSSTMPDVIKGNTTTAFEPFVEQYANHFGAFTDERVTRSQKGRCKSFHYFDTPINSLGGPPLNAAGHTPAMAKSNASVALQLAKDRLREIQNKPVISFADRREQAWWLGWIEHIIGDLHQPLHCAEDFGINKNGDGGGNLFKVTDPLSGGETSLHSLWDGAIDRIKLDESKEGHSSRYSVVTMRWLNEQNISQFSPQAREQNERVWIEEGAELAQANVYADIKPSGMPLQNYLTRQTKVVKKQAVLGGLRLTNLLNQILGS